MQHSSLKLNADAIGVSPGMLERRADTRHVAVRWHAMLEVGELRTPCVIHNIGETAIIAEIFAPRSAGEEVRIDLGDAQYLDGAVVWASETNVEVRLREPIDMTDLIERHDAAPKASAEEPPLMAISCQGWLELGSESFMVEVCDLSQGGARIAADIAPEPGQGIRLVIKGLPPIAGEVRWRDDGKLGIAFDEHVAFETLTDWIMARDVQIGSHGQSRRWPRYSILLKTVARVADVAEPIDAIVHNISRGGVLVTCRRGLHIGDHVELGLGPAGHVAGLVMWVGGNDAGIEFNRTIDTEHVLHPRRERSVPPLIQHHVVGRRPGLYSHKTH